MAGTPLESPTLQKQIHRSPLRQSKRDNVESEQRWVKALLWCRGKEALNAVSVFSSSIRPTPQDCISTPIMVWCQASLWNGHPHAARCQNCCCLCAGFICVDKSCLLSFIPMWLFQKLPPIACRLVRKNMFGVMYDVFIWFNITKLNVNLIQNRQQEESIWWCAEGRLTFSAVTQQVFSFSLSHWSRLKWTWEAVASAMLNRLQAAFRSQRARDSFFLPYY